MNPLYAKLQEIGGVFREIKPNKLNGLLLLSCCVLRSRSCNLHACRDEVAQVTGEEELKAGTAYQRLLRVFQTGCGLLYSKAVFLLILYLLRPSGKVLLVIDRTDFKIGNGWVNLLVFGLEWLGVFIPLVWQDLAHAGACSQANRIALLDRLLAWWKASGLELPVFYLTADREFTGHQWVEVLHQRQVKYAIRIKANARFQVRHNGKTRKKTKSLKTLARYMRRYQLRQKNITTPQGRTTKLMMLPQENPRDPQPYVLLISNLDSYEEARACFRKRWPIECCFKHLKSNGFNLEDINLEQPHKKEIFFTVLTLVYVLAIHQGYQLQCREAVKIRSYNKDKLKLYRRESLFRFGLFHIKRIISSLNQIITHLIQLLEQCSNSFILKKSVVQA